jgi:hypothetical protein
VSDTQFIIKRAQEFPRGPTSVSMLGVFYEGRMSPEAWEQLGPALSAPFGQRRCEAAYDVKLEREDPQLFAELDSYTQSNGVTDDLLQELAPRASGELILSISVHGRAGVTTRGGSIDPRLAKTQHQPLPTSRSSRQRDIQGVQGVSPSQMSTPLAPLEDTDLEIAAVLFSAQKRRSVGRVSVIYTGKNPEDVIKRFAERLGAELPGAACRGWQWAEPAKEQPGEPAREPGSEPAREPVKEPAPAE